MTRWSIDVHFRHPDGRVQRVRRSSPVNTRRGAERLEHEVRGALLAGTYQGEEEATVANTYGAEVPTLAVFSEEFLQCYAVANNKPSEVKAKRMILRRHLIPFFGGLRLDQIGVRQIELFKSRSLERVSRKTLNNHLTVLRKLLVVACDWELIEAVPTVKWVRCPKASFRFLDFEEAEHLLATSKVEPEWHAMILLGLRSGLRQGELLALRWSDIDVRTRQLTVARSVWEGVVGTPKNGRSRRVPLAAPTLDVLARQRRGPLVFAQPSGEMLSPGLCRAPLTRARKRAGLAELGWHDLRHTFASHLTMRGTPMPAVQQLMGHSTIEMTMRYAHLAPHVLQAAVEVLEPRHIDGTQNEPKKKTGS